MTDSDKRYGALLDALHNDLPNKQDEARVRSKLAAAGVVVGVAAMTSTSAHAATNVLGAAKSTSLLPASKAISALGSAAPVAAASKTSSLLGTAWLSLSTGTKLAVVGATLAGAGYPAVKYWSAGPEVPSAQSAAVVSELPSRSVSRSTERLPPRAATSETLNVPSELAANSTTAQDARSVELGGARAHDIAPPKKFPTSTSNVGHGELPRTSEPSSVALTSVPTPSDRVAETRLSEEASLIERALVATRAKEPAAAKRWLAEHEARFPNGVLARERERLRSNLE